MAYDITQEAHEFIADDRSAALAKACAFFGVEEGDLAITEFQPGQVHGMGARTLVVAIPRELLGRERPASDRESRDRGPRERGGRERGGRERGGRERGGRERGGRDRGRGGRDRERGGRDRERGRREARDPEPRREQVDEEPVGPSVGEVKGSLGEIGRFVQGVIERMELGPFEISESSEDELLAIQVGGAAAPRLAGSDGRAVDALQLLANQAAGQIEEDPPRVVLDVEGDADARESRLTKLAERVARRARETGRSVRLDAMNGKDRRIIHLALRDEEDVATMSTGEGPYRQVVIVPADAPEFEEALRESEKAAQRD